MSEATNGKVNGTAAVLTRKDFATDQEVRWCPGCGDYSILAQTQKVMPDLGVPREKIVFVFRHWLLESFFPITCRRTDFTPSTAARRPLPPA